MLREGGSAELADAIARGEIDIPLVEEPDREMLRYAGKLTMIPGEMVEDDVIRLRDAGFSDAAIGDMAITISMYAYMNRIVDGIGGSLPRGMDREARRLGLGRFAAEAVPAGDD